MQNYLVIIVTWMKNWSKIQTILGSTGKIVKAYMLNTIAINVNMFLL